MSASLTIKIKYEAQNKKQQGKDFLDPALIIGFRLYAFAIYFDKSKFDILRFTAYDIFRTKCEMIYISCAVRHISYSIENQIYRILKIYIEYFAEIYIAVEHSN